MDHLENDIEELGRAWRDAYTDKSDVSELLASATSTHRHWPVGAPVAILLVLAVSGVTAVVGGRYLAGTGSVAPSAAVSPASVPIPLLTSPAGQDACELAEAQGMLVADARSGLGLRSAAGRETEIRWPYGYTAYVDAGRAALLNSRGEVVAHEREEVQVDGGFDAAGDVWTACPGTTLYPSVRLAPSGS